MIYLKNKKSQKLHINIIKIYLYATFAYMGVAQPVISHLSKQECQVLGPMASPGVPKGSGYHPWGFYTGFPAVSHTQIQTKYNKNI